MSDKLHSGNIGEWSELYVLSYLLAHGGAHGADATQSSLEDVFYEVLSIQLQDTKTKSSKFRIVEDEVIIAVGDGAESAVKRSAIEEAARALYLDLTSGDNKRTFELDSGSKLAELLHRDFISADSSQRTSDLELVISDEESNSPRPKVGFSIKSQLGSPSTLLNASGATNFTFVLDGRGADCDFNELELDEASIQANLAKLRSHGFRLELEAMDSEIFAGNLELIDSQMVENVATVLATFYSTTANSVADVAEIAFPSDATGSMQRRFKIKQMLGAIAMGLRPSSPWDGDVTKFKGLIVVKADGEVVFYYLNNLAEFQDFLFNSLKFEVASRTRHGFGYFYLENGLRKIKLNLQIRFKN